MRTAARTGVMAPRTGATAPQAAAGHRVGAEPSPAGRPPGAPGTLGGVSPPRSREGPGGAPPPNGVQWDLKPDVRRHGQNPEDKGLGGRESGATPAGEQGTRGAQRGRRRPRCSEDQEVLVHTRPQLAGTDGTGPRAAPTPLLSPTTPCGKILREHTRAIISLYASDPHRRALGSISPPH